MTEQGPSQHPPLGRRGLSMGRMWAIAAALIILALLAGVAVAAGGGHKSRSGSVSSTTRHSTTQPSTAPTSSPRATTSVAVTPTAVPTTTTPTTVRSPATTSSTLSPSVTAGTAVPWSPQSSNTLVGDSGNPKDWPGAQPNPPSLAGAYSDNMIKVVVTLYAYSDWLNAHPDPALVREIAIPGTSDYLTDISALRKLQEIHWHTSGEPREIDWIAVTRKPKQVIGVRGAPLIIGGHKRFTPAVITVVYSNKVEPIYNAQHQVVQHVDAARKAVLSLTIGQGTDGRWRFMASNVLHPPHLNELVR